MIRHTILFKVRPFLKDEELNIAINKICDLKNKLSGIISITAGECYFHDEKSTDFFSSAVSHGFSIDFIDQIALDKFFNDPITHPAKDAIINISEGGYQGIVGFDFVDKYK